MDPVHVRMKEYWFPDIGREKYITQVRPSQ